MTLSESTSRIRGLVAAALVAVAAVGLVSAPPLAAHAAALPFTINDLRVIPDEAPGDGVCGNSAYLESGEPACTLYGALQEANALGAGDAVTITAGSTMYEPVSGAMVAEGSTRLNVFPNSGVTAGWDIWNPEAVDTMIDNDSWDDLGQSWDGDYYVAYYVGHDDVTIDFDNRIGTFTTSDGPQQVTLGFNAANGTLSNFDALSTGDALTSAEAVVTVGARASNTSLINGEISNNGAAYAERGVVITEGSGDVTIDSVSFNAIWQSNVIFAGVEHGSFPNPGTIGNVAIRNSNFDLYDSVTGDSYGIDTWLDPDSVASLSITGSTFTDPRIGVGSVVNWGSGASLGSFTFTGNTVDASTADSSQPDYSLYFATSGSIGDVTVSDNAFTNVGGSTLHLNGPTGITGAVVVDGNTVSGANGNQSRFVRFDTNDAASPKAQVTNNTITGFNTYAVAFTLGDYDVLDISGNVIDASADPGTYAVDISSPSITADTTTIADNTISGFDYSVRSNGSQGLGAMSVTGNVFDNTASPGATALYIIHSGSLDSFTVTDNSFLNYTYRAIDYEYGGPATDGVRITGNTFDSSGVAGGGTVGVAISTEADPITVLDISDNTFTDLERAVYLYAFDVSDMSITGNTFTQNQSTLKNEIFIESSVEFSGTNVISGNAFAQNTAATPGVSDDQAFIHWSADSGSTPGDAGFVGTISNNRFDGGAVSSAILLQGNQLLSVFQNTAAGIGDSTYQTQAYENSANVYNPVSNWDTVNERPRTAYPTAASVCGTGVVITLDYADPGPGGNDIAGAILVDVYGSSAADGMAMDSYLGQISTTVEALPATFVIPASSAIADDIRSGGLVRVQTLLNGGTVDGDVVPTGTSSQLSRIIAADESLGCPVDIAASSFDVTTGMKAPDGAAAHTVTVDLTDTNGDPAVGYAGVLEANDASGTVAFGSWVDNGDGSYSAPITSATAGAFPITIALGGDPITRVVYNDTALFGGPPVIDLTASIYEVTTGSKHADGSAAHTLTVKLVDTDGDPVTGLANLLAPAESTGTVSFGSWVDNGDGTYSAPITSTTAGSFPITVAYNDEPLSFEVNDTAKFSEVPKVIDDPEDPEDSNDHDKTGGLALTGAAGLGAGMALVGGMLAAGLLLLARRRQAE